MIGITVYSAKAMRTEVIKRHGVRVQEMQERLISDIPQTKETGGYF